MSLAQDQQTDETTENFPPIPLYPPSHPYTLSFLLFFLRLSIYPPLLFHYPRSISRQCVDTKCQMSQMSGYDSVNLSSRALKVNRDSANVTSGGRQFHTWGPPTENARLPTVKQWTGGWMRQSLSEYWVKHPIRQINWPVQGQLLQVK